MPKFRHLVSKVVIDPLRNSQLAKEILEWVADSKPLVVVSKQKKGADK